MDSEESEVVDDLTYLAQHLTSSRARIENLEKELEELRTKCQSIEIKKEEQVEEQMRGVRAESKAQTKGLKEQNTLLWQWSSALEGALKVKKENAEEEVSALEAERTLRATLETKYQALETRVKERTELAAKALREKVDVEKALDAMRTDFQDANRRAGELQRIADKLSVAQSASAAATEKAIADWRSKYEVLRVKNNEQRAQLQGIEAAHETKTQELKKTIRQLVEGAVTSQITLQALGAERDGLNTKCAELATQVRTVWEEARHVGATRDELRREYDRKSDEADKWQKAAETKHIEWLELGQRCVQLGSTVKALEARRPDDRGALELSQRCMYLEDRIQQLEARRADEAGSLQVAQQRCVQLESRIRELEERRADDAGSLQLAQQRCVQRESKIKELEGRRASDGASLKLAQHRCIQLEAKIKELEGRRPEDGGSDDEDETGDDAMELERKKLADAQDAYAKFMLGLPTARVNRPDGKLKPVASETDNLHAYLAQIPGSKSWLDHILYLPGRTMSLNDGRHILAFAPTHRHHPTRQWIEGSDLVAYDGSTREVFVDENGFVFYAGTYQCHRLNNVYPGGTIPPSTISVKEITDAIFGAIRPSGWSGILHRQFPSGPIRVEATGLNLVGFNGPLYNTLRTQFTELKNARLRTMGSGSMETHRFSKFARLIILDRGLGAIPQDNRDA